MGALLALVVLLGLSLRLYHITYPPGGYLSLKEVQYLSIAKGYAATGDFRHRTVHYLGMEAGPGLAEDAPQVPFISLLLLALWRVFPDSIVAARMAIVASSLGAIVMTFLVVRRLGGGALLSLLTAFYVGVLPLSSYFGRCFQPDMPTFLLLLLCTHSFLRWTVRFRFADLCLFNVFFVLTALSKINFLLGVIPLLFMIPYRRLKDPGMRRESLRLGLTLALSAAVIGGWLIFSQRSLRHETTLFSFLDAYYTGLSWEVWSRKLPSLLTNTIRNYSLPLLLLFLAGLPACLLGERSPLRRYVVGSAVFLLVHSLFTLDLMVVHSYYQMPLLLFVALGISVAVERLVLLVSARLQSAWHAPKLITSVVAAAGMSLSLWSVAPDLLWHYDTFAIGADVAGRYIREHSRPEERVFLSYGSPSDMSYHNRRSNYYGVFLEADRRGDALPDSLQRIVFGEKERRMSWILLYDVPWLPRDAAIAEHIRNNYSLAQSGFLDGKLLYYLLRKGGPFDPTALNSAPLLPAGEYKFSTGTRKLYVKER